jgi:hypothetical protein
VKLVSSNRPYFVKKKGANCPFELLWDTRSEPFNQQSSVVRKNMTTASSETPKVAVGYPTYKSVCHMQNGTTFLLLLYTS